MQMKSFGQQKAIGEAIAIAGYSTERGHLTRAGYSLVTDVMPIICVDMIPVDFLNGAMRMGIITRATGPEQGKPAILGGRIQKNERIAGAISRHLEGSFGDGDFDFHPGNDEDSPFYVAQYKHAPTDEGGYDPTKHAIAMTYLVEIEEPEAVSDEAQDFRWITSEQIPEVTAYNHGIALHKAADFLRLYG